MKKIESGTYKAVYLEEENRILLQGDLRLESVEKYDEIINFISDNTLSSKRPVILDITRLETLNSSGIAALGMLMVEMKRHDREISIIGSRYISWQTLSLEGFKDINEKLSIEFAAHH